MERWRREGRGVVARNWETAWRVGVGRDEGVYLIALLEELARLGGAVGQVGRELEEVNLRLNFARCLSSYLPLGMEGTRAAPGSSPPGFESLPPELVTAILSRSSLSSVIAIAQVSRGLRRLCTSEHVAWTTPCNRAAIEAGIHVFDSDRNDERSNEAFEHLAGLGVRSCVPPRAFVLLYPNLSRNFLLYHAELPRLKDDSWKEICEGRFSVSAMTSEKEKEREAGGVPSKGRWKEAFFRIIGKLEHRVETGCSKEEHLVSSLSSRSEDTANLLSLAL